MSRLNVSWSLMICSRFLFSTAFIFSSPLIVFNMPRSVFADETSQVIGALYGFHSGGGGLFEKWFRVEVIIDVGFGGTWSWGGMILL